MDGLPCLLVGVERVGGDGAGFAQGIEVVDEGEATVLIAEAGDVEDVFGFVEVVTVVAVGQDLRVDVAGLGLVDVGDDLVVYRRDGGAVGLGGVFGCLFVALILVEDADWDIEDEADGVFGSGAVVVGFDGGVGGTVGVGKFYLGIGDGDCGLGSLEVGARG